MTHPVLEAIGRAAFTPLGWFAPSAADGVPPDTRFVILIGNAGTGMFRRFARERDPLHDTLDGWTRVAVEALAAELDATPVYPFDKPYPPILTWARKGGAGHVSPLGLNIHPVHGLWHAYRAALLFKVAVDLPPPTSRPSPCDACVARPCLSACPVGAFTGHGYDETACITHIASPAGQDCMRRGCLARHACPVGQAYAYEPAQAQFHMRAHVKARLSR
jgi:ferredoxin